VRREKRVCKIPLQRYILKLIEVLWITGHFCFSFILFLYFESFYECGCILKSRNKFCQVLVAYTCDPSFSKGSDQEDNGLKPALRK
jgi:hypothetical protein